MKIGDYDVLGLLRWYSNLQKLNSAYASAADPDHYDLDLTFHFDATPDLDPTVWSLKAQLCLNETSLVFGAGIVCLYFCTMWGRICKECQEGVATYIS